MTKTNFSEDFGPFNGKIWLNCSHQGALPRVAVQEAYEAISWKIAPYNLTTERFTETPLRLKQALSRLISTSPDQIILGNSASYGLHLLANGIRLKAGDEILLVKGDFPSNILPWLALRKNGVTVRLIEPRNHFIQPDELLQNLTSASKLFCASWVHSFSGFTVDVDALGKICRSNGLQFVLNVSQALGARLLNVATDPVDAITCVGFKWLCGPYGTGFCWIRPDLRDSLEYNQAYWLSTQTADDLANQSDEPQWKYSGARSYDIFGTANFFNFKPWRASVEYLLEQRLEMIADYDQNLVSRFIDGLDSKKYNLISPREGPARSTLIFVSHKDPARNDEIYKALIESGIFPAFRRGRLRFSPHLYNTAADIDQAVSALNAF